MYSVSDVRQLHGLKYEYAFYDVVRRYNEQLVKNAASDAYFVDGLISRSMAVQLHDALNNYLMEHYSHSMDGDFSWHAAGHDDTDMTGYLTPGQFAAGLNAVWQKYIGDINYTIDNVDNQASSFYGSMAAFNAHSGLDAVGNPDGYRHDPDGQATMEWNGSLQPLDLDDTFIPLSPYDPRVRNLSVFSFTETYGESRGSQVVGNQLLLLSGRDIDADLSAGLIDVNALPDKATLYTSSTGNIDLDGQGVDAFGPVPVQHISANDHSEMENVPFLQRKRDLVGVSALVPYLGQDQRAVNDLVDWAIAPYADDIDDVNSRFESRLLHENSKNGRDYRRQVQAQFENAAKQVEYLKNLGYSVEVMKAARPGQLKARVTRDGRAGYVDMRLTGLIPVMQVADGVSHEDGNYVVIPSEPRVPHAEMSGSGAPFVTGRDGHWVEVDMYYHVENGLPDDAIPFDQQRYDDSRWVGQAYDSKTGSTYALELQGNVYDYGQKKESGNVTTDFRLDQDCSQTKAGHIMPRAGTGTGDVSYVEQLIPTLAALGESIDYIADADTIAGDPQATIQSFGPSGFRPHYNRTDPRGSRARKASDMWPTGRGIGRGNNKTYSSDFRRINERGKDLASGKYFTQQDYLYHVSGVPMREDPQTGKWVPARTTADGTPIFNKDVDLPRNRCGVFPRWIDEQGNQVIMTRPIPGSAYRAELFDGAANWVSGTGEGRRLHLSLKPLIGIRRVEDAQGHAFNQRFNYNGLGLVVKPKSDAVSSVSWMAPELAEERLRAFVAEAADNLRSDINLSELQRFVEAERAGEQVPAKFDTDNETVSKLRENLYELLAGRANMIKIPRADITEDADRDASDETAASDIYGVDESAASNDWLFVVQNPDDPYERFEVAQNAVDAFVDSYIGTYEPSTDQYGAGYTFNPTHVAEFVNLGGINGREQMLRYIRNAWEPDDQFTGSALARYGRGFTREMLEERVKSLRGSDEARRYFHDRLISFDSDNVVMSVSYGEDGQATWSVPGVEFRADGKPRTESAFVTNMQDVLTSIHDAVRSMGYGVTAIQVDEQGIVHWEANRTMKQMPMTFNTTTGQWDTVSDEDRTKPITGEIGQIFVPGDNGLVRTAFAASDNALLAVGYQAVVTDDLDDGLDSADRVRLYGYMDNLKREVTKQVRSDIAADLKSSRLGDAASINGFYRHVNAEKLPLDYFEDTNADRMNPEIPDELLDARVEENLCKVTFPSWLVDEASILRAWPDISELREQYAANPGDMGNDAVRDGYSRMGRIFAVPSQSWMHILSHADTQDNKRTGGTTYLESRDAVSEDGHIIPSDDVVLSPLEQLAADVLPNTSRDNLFRRRMAVSHLKDLYGMDTDREDASGRIQAQDAGQFYEVDSSAYAHHGEAVPLHGPIVAQVSMRGWTQDDGFLISGEFARSHMVPDMLRRDPNAENYDPGAMRPLGVGDKLADAHGNKGTVAQIIDRSWSQAEAESRDLTYEWDFLRHNPGVDLVIAQGSIVSRANAGTALDMIDHPHNIMVPDGKGGWEKETGSAGELPIFTLDKLADTKTSLYDGSDGRGRNIGWLSSNSLNARGCDRMMTDVFGANERGLRNVREWLLSMGVAVDETGTMSMDASVIDQEVKKRSRLEPKYDLSHKDLANEIDNLSVGKPLTYGNSANNSGTSIDKAANTLATQLERKGGYLEIPFPIKFPSVEVKDGDGESTTLGGMTIPYNAETGMYQLPVLSASLRSGTEDRDGSIVTHDYTNDYIRIYKQALIWTLADQAEQHASDANWPYYEQFYNAKSDGTRKKSAKSPEEIRRIAQETKNKAMESAQKSFDHLTDDITKKQFSDSKWNAFAAGMMRVAVSGGAATAIWTPDPRLEIDQVKISKEIAQLCNLSDDDVLMVVRDPSLVSSAMRSMRVVVDDSADDDLNRLHGIAVNPAVPKAMTGDFDGDTVAGVAPRSKAAADEIRKRLSFESNLFDFDHMIDADGKVQYKFDLGLTDGDMAPILYRDPSVKDAIEDLRLQAMTPLGAKVQLSDGSLADGMGIVSRAAVLNGPMTPGAVAEGCDPRQFSGGEIAENARKVLKQLHQIIDDALKVHIGSNALAYGYEDASGNLVGSRSLYAMSVKANVIDTGYKGSDSKLNSVLPQLGLEAAWDDEQGKFALKDNGLLDLTDKEFDEAAMLKNDQDTLLAMIAKSWVTGMAGSVDKKALSALSGVSTDAGKDGSWFLNTATVIGEGAYQGVLDVKTSPEKANKIVEALVGALPQLLYRGTNPTCCLDEKAADSRTWIPGVDYDKKTMRLSADKWVERVYDVYRYCGVDSRLNKGYLKAVAEQMVDADGFVVGFEGMSKGGRGALLHNLAFAPSSKVIFTAAEGKHNLFEQSMSRPGMVDESNPVANYMPVSARKARLAQQAEPMMQQQETQTVAPAVEPGVRKHTRGQFKDIFDGREMRDTSMLLDWSWKEQAVMAAAEAASETETPSGTDNFDNL